MLTCNNIRKSYNNTEVLRGVSVCIEAGKITALIGPSGSGKTTLLKTLTLLEYPNSGTISIEEASYNFPLEKAAHVKPPWPKVTAVFQQLFLWPHLTLRENITLPLIAMGKQNKNGHLNELIELFDMQAFIDHYPNEASLGQRQRAALVRALVLDPVYILLDEITSSLDVEQVGIILSHLKTLSKQGIGILSITHLLHFAHEAADQVIFLDGGEILEIGGPEVLKSPSHERVQKFLSVIESAS